MHTETLCIHGHDISCDSSGSITVPIYQSATYAHPALGKSTGYDYVRAANPTREALEQSVCKLEHGQAALAFSSGMAAVAAVMELFQNGDHIVTCNDLYGGSWRLFDKISKKNGLTFTSVDSSNLQLLESAITKQTKAIFIETPSNPLMKVANIAAIATIAHQRGALLIVDNTFLTPILQNPLLLGADIVVHSATKYLGGHNDTLAGIVVCADKTCAEKIEFVRLTTGAPLSPFDSWLILRGLKTLALRVNHQSQSALKIAQWLSKCPAVSQVYYPGLPTHPQYDLSCRQAQGSGGMISFELVAQADTTTQISTILEKLKIFAFAESLGGVESLITYPSTQTHAAIPAQIRHSLGISETLLRISVGLENVDDLIADLAQAIGVTTQNQMTPDFDRVIDRTHTGSLKYDCALERNKPADVLPMWVADMDFQCPQAVTDALQKMCEHAIYGYSQESKAYFSALERWFKQRHQWQVHPQWLVKTPGVVFALCAAIKAFTKVGDAILIQPPVYYPFAQSITDNGRQTINNPLVLKNGRYVIDFEDFERKIIQNHVRMFILCNPHNPVGRVWTRDELLKLATICQRHDVLIVSDEIHADFTFKGYSYTPFGTLGSQYANNAIICTSPSKTFNLAGLQVSNIFIANETLRQAFQKQIDATGYSQMNTAGLIAAQAAYEHGEHWLDSLLDYLQDNLNYLRDYLQQYLPQIRLIEPEGTYLPWLDFSETKLSGEQLEQFLLNKAHLWLDVGSIFGTNAQQFARMNIACPRATLQRAMKQLQQAFEA